MIDVYENVDGFDALKLQWERIEQNKNMRIFQSWHWSRNAWLEVLSKDNRNRLWLAKWSQDGRDDAVICPFYIDAKGVLRFIFDLHSDVCDCVYGDASTLHWAFKEIAETIQGESRIKSVWLQKMNGDSAALNYLGVFLRGAFVGRDNAYSWVASPQCDDFIVAQAQMKSKDKADLKAIRRKGEKDHLCILSAENGDAFPRELILKLRSHMMAESRNGNFLTDDMIDFSEKIYQSGRCEILVLNRENETVALNFLLKKDGHYLSWVFLYTDPRTSSEMYVKYMTGQAKLNSFVFDFGVGVYDYKIGTFRPQTALTYSLRYSSRKSEMFKALMFTDVRFLKDYLKSLAK